MLGHLILNCNSSSWKGVEGHLSKKNKGRAELGRGRKEKMSKNSSNLVFPYCGNCAGSVCLPRCGMLTYKKENSNSIPLP